jgi:hypothetical protein
LEKRRVVLFKDSSANKVHTTSLTVAHLGAHFARFTRVVSPLRLSKSWLVWDCPTRSTLST